MRGLQWSQHDNTALQPSLLFSPPSLPCGAGHKDRALREMASRFTLSKFATRILYLYLLNFSSCQGQPAASQCELFCTKKMRSKNTIGMAWILSRPTSLFQSCTLASALLPALSSGRKSQKKGRLYEQPSRLSTMASLSASFLEHFFTSFADFSTHLSGCFEGYENRLECEPRPRYLGDHQSVQ